MISLEHHPKNIVVEDLKGSTLPGSKENKA
jgi:hypothetical protein